MNCSYAGERLNPLNNSTTVRRGVQWSNIPNKLSLSVSLGFRLNDVQSKN